MVWSKPFSHKVYRVAPKLTNIDIDFERASELPRTFWWNISNQRKFLDWLSRKLEIKDQSDWYKVATSTIESNGGAVILSQYDNSISKTLKTLLPEYIWDDWKFSQKLPNGFWDNSLNQRKYLEYLFVQMEFKKMEDWYLIKKVDFERYGGFGLLNKYGNSVSKTIMSVFPEYEWLPWKFESTSPNFWKDEKNQRKYIEWLGKELGYKNKEDWYQIKQSDIIQHGGSTLLHLYGGSPSKTIMSIYKEKEWKDVKFSKLPNKYWNVKENQRKFLTELSSKLNIKQMQDWYNIKQQDIIQHGGSSLLSLFNNSPSSLIMSVFSEYNWEPWRFSTIATGFWEKPENQRKYMKHLAKKLNIKEQKDWYQISSLHFLENRGKSLLALYNSSPSRVVTSVFKEYEWEHWRFAKLPNTWDTSIDESRSKVLMPFISFLQQKLKIEHLDDWYRVSRKQISQYGSPVIIDSFGGLANALQIIYPNHKWESRMFSSRGKRSSQYALKIGVSDLFPGKEILENHLHPNLIFSSSGENMELDLFIPSINLAFEYQGEQHYNSSSFFGSQQIYQLRDQEKREECEKKGITLIEIPYWWDGSKSSLLSTIFKVRSDLFPDFSGEINPIPNSPPEYISPHNIQLEPFTTFFPQLWEDSRDPIGCFISEYLEGISVLWTGSKLVNRKNQELKAPFDFLSKLPKDISLQGFIWAGRGNFQNLLAALKDKRAWEFIEFWALDCPTLETSFEERIQFIKTLQVKSFDFVKCSSEIQFTEFFNQITEKGGYGLLIVHPDDNKNHSNIFVKRKTMESEVKCLGSHDRSFGLLCEHPNGTQCIVQCSSQTFENTPKNKIITVQHQGYWRSGKLRQPVFYRTREDLSWEEVLLDWISSSNKEIEI